MDLQAGLFGMNLRLKKEGRFFSEFEVPVSYTSNWKLDNSTKLHVCSDLNGQPSAFCYVQHLMTWPTFVKDQLESLQYMGDESSTLNSVQVS